MTEEDVIEDKWISKAIEHAQEKVEKNNFDSRKNLLEYDDVMNQHRKVIYAYRYSVLEGEEEMHDLVREMISAAVESAFKRFVPERLVTEEQAEMVIDFLASMCQLEKSTLEKQLFNTKQADLFQSDITDFLVESYNLYRTSDNEEMMDNAEKWVMLETVDQSWKQHMFNLDHLKEGIYLRSWGQKNPLIEYKREAFVMFQDMMQSIRWEIVHRIFRLSLQRIDTREIERKRQKELDSLSMSSASSDDIHANVTAKRDTERVGRNDDCPCGSGKKYKKCCG